MNHALTFDPLVPMPVLWAAAALVALLSVVVLWRGRSGAFVRTLALLALLGAIANPVLRQEERQPLSNVAVVVRDTSPSQTIAGRAGVRDALTAQVTERMAALPNLEVRQVDAGSGDDDGTRLFTPLERALGDIPSDRLAGVVIITDGQVHDVPEQLAAVPAGVPVHTVLTGPKGEFDRRITVVSAPRYGLVGTTGEVVLRIDETARDGNRRAASAGAERVTITTRDQEGREQRFQARLGRNIRVPLSFPRAGKNLLEIQTPTVPGELTALNNKLVVQAEGVRENLRVLLVSGEPHAGERTWRNLLKSDAAVDLVHFTILRPPEKQDGTPINELSLIAFPTRELFSEKLDDFDLIIFDRYQRRGVLPLLYLDNIAQYVSRNGGAVLLAAGSDFATFRSLYRTPLGAVLPAEPTGRVVARAFRPQLTGSGARHPVTRTLPGAGIDAAALAPDGQSAGQPGDTADGAAASSASLATANATNAGTPTWGRWFRVIETRERPGDHQVVMRGADDLPLLILDRQGEGRVAMLLSDHAWLWARGLDGGGPHRPLLRRLAHWLMKEPDLEEEALSAVAKGNTLTIERRSMSPVTTPVTVTDPNGQTAEVTLQSVGNGLWRAEYTAKLPGLHRFANGGLNAVAHAGRLNAKEFTNATTTAAELEPISEITGGGVFWPVDRAGATAGTADDATTGAPADATAAASAAVDRAALSPPRVSLVRSGSVLHSSSWMGLRDRDAALTTGVQLTPLAEGFFALAVLLGLMAGTWWREGRT